MLGLEGRHEIPCKLSLAKPQLLKDEDFRNLDPLARTISKAFGVPVFQLSIHWKTKTSLESEQAHV